LTNIKQNITEVEAQLADMGMKKADFSDFQILQKSVNKERATEILVDMQKYVNEQLTDIQRRVNDDKVDTVERINDLCQLVEERVHKSDMNQIQKSVKKAEKYITNVSIQSSIKHEKNDLVEGRAAIHGYMAQVEIYNGKMEAMEKRMMGHEEKLAKLLNNANIKGIIKIYYYRFKS
jgi:hypothetical protein